MDVEIAADFQVLLGIRKPKLKCCRRLPSAPFNAPNICPMPSVFASCVLKFGADAGAGAIILRLRTDGASRPIRRDISSYIAVIVSGQLDEKKGAMVAI